MDKDDPTYFAIVYADADYPELEAVNGGCWVTEDVYQFTYCDCEMRLVKGVTIFDSPEEALDAAIAGVYKEIDNDIQALKSNCRYMRTMGEQLHDPNLFSSGNTPYDEVLLSATTLPVKFASAAAALQKYAIQYAHLVEIAYL